MVHTQAAAPQRVAERLWCVKHVRLAHDGRHAAEQALLLLRHLLHVIAFAESRFIAVNVIDADAVRCGSERAREGLHGARADRRDHRGDLAVLPTQGRRGVRHFDFVAAVDRPRSALFLIDAQHIAEIGRAVSENCKVLAHALLQQAEHKRFGQRDFGQLLQALVQGLLQASGSVDGAGSRAHVRQWIGRLRVKHHAFPSCSRRNGAVILFHSCQWRR